MLGFTLDSFDSFKQRVRIVSPVGVPSSVRIVEDITVIGREGSLSRVAGWQDNTISFDLLIMSDDVPGSYRELARVCLDAQRLTLSGQPGRFRRVKHARVSELVREGSWGKCSLEVTCEPFAYHVYNPVVSFDSSRGGVTLNNPGVVYSRPELTLSGRGSIRFSVNGKEYVVRDVASSVKVDSSLLLVSAGSDSSNPTLRPDFPLLIPGENKIVLLTDNSAMSIVGNWRDL